MIVVNAFTALLNFLASNSYSETFQANISSSKFIASAFLGVANVIFAVCLLQWNKIGFWGFLTTSMIVLITNLNIGISVKQSLLGLLGIVVLYAVFQIKKNAVPAWDYLK
ncbi:MAG: hypothetical protein CMC55_05185 [Flavobacteriaceae bacterium]|uniref:hypothetical protein n=1 Tax=Bizionia echini TaxID=649333 RepID=UPI000C9748D8|nr:hypothetical protein [Flavobacteriaceae bacterium]